MPDLKIIDVIDIVLVGSMLYYIYVLMRRSKSAYLFRGIVIFAIVWLLASYIFEMRLLGGILDRFVNVGVLALVVLFQDEIRRLFTNIGRQQHAGRLYQLVTLSFRKGHSAKSYDFHDEIMAIVMACASMGRQKVGALIVVEGHVSLSEEKASGERIDARISQRLLENIFFKNSPLHDGALIISHNRLHSAGCILPVSHDQDIPKSLGLRHRAALGISQKTDALAIVVSEETGAISVANKGQFKLHLNKEDLENLLTQAFETQPKE